jgi:hypothetical protein
VPSGEHLFISLLLLIFGHLCFFDGLLTRRGFIRFFPAGGDGGLPGSSTCLSIASRWIFVSSNERTSDA